MLIRMQRNVLAFLSHDGLLTAVITDVNNLPKNVVCSVKTMAVLIACSLRVYSLDGMMPKIYNCIGVQINNGQFKYAGESHTSSSNISV